MKDGYRNGEPIYCTVNAWDCPYFKKGLCAMYPKEGDPMEECDDFYFFWESWENYDAT